ncbi:MAG TPA: hypothetical protein VHY58_09395 [Streptosporangiaceae bacterium]|jgi:hypothetical protein|nr:hypothetical protein [Streptosporangiaceae bacterium]
MFQKSRILAVAALTAGTVGLWASAAYAGTYTGPSGDNGGLLNASHNQVSGQACGDEVPVNVLGVQVPVNRVAAALGLLSTAPTVAAQNSSCKQAQMQSNDPATDSMRASASKMSSSHMSGNGWGWSYSGPSGDNGGLVNVSHNQVPLQLCNDTVPVNVLGVQVPVDQLAGALGILSTDSQLASQDSSCKQGSAQDNS